MLDPYLKEILNYHRRRSMSFTEFVENCISHPEDHIHTSSNLISEAIKHFGYEIVVRAGQPVISYNIFKDIFANGINAVYGQDHCIKHIVEVIDSISKESGPNRGLVLVGPPASGKTNIVDLISLSIEQYSKENNVKLYSFYYQFVDVDAPDKIVEIRSAFSHNPILLFTNLLHQKDGVTKPRQSLFEYINKSQKEDERITFPSYYQTANLDKRNLDIIESLIQNPLNKELSLFEIFEKYVRVEEIEFSNAQGDGIANIDDMSKLQARVKAMDSREDALRILNQHLPTKLLYHYEGALVSASRGLLHIHDAFGEITREADYKPLLMLLGSGKISLESTQASLDTTVVITTNIEELHQLEKQLTSSKLLDRIEKIPVNYLLDANAEMEILKRDMANMKDKYEVDPNLLSIASYFSVMTRLLPPNRKKFPSEWSDDKKNLYNNITPEQKLFIYSCKSEDPVNTIKKLPHWHPFRNEAIKMKIDIHDSKKLKEIIREYPDALTLENSAVFRPEELELIDDEFMRELWNEHYPSEGKMGISVRQLQNIMRNTISASDGRRIEVGIFINQLNTLITEGGSIHNWLNLEDDMLKDKKPVRYRKIGPFELRESQGDYGDYKGLIKVVETIYSNLIRREIITATVDRDPEKIEDDLRRYMQYALLSQALENKAFSHIMVPRYTFIDPVSGHKVDSPDHNFMESIESIIAEGISAHEFRRQLTQKFFELGDLGKLTLEEGKTVVFSRKDNFLINFEKEYHLLLSHRKSNLEISGEELKEAFFQKLNDQKGYLNLNVKLRELVETILHNLSRRRGYTRGLALRTVVYALRKEIIDFTKILN